MFLYSIHYYLSHKLTNFLENFIAVRTMKNSTVNVLVSFKLRTELFTVVQILQINSDEIHPSEKVKLKESH